jgi:hypothetical protein
LIGHIGLRTVDLESHSIDLDRIFLVGFQVVARRRFYLRTDRVGRIFFFIETSPSAKMPFESTAVRQVCSHARQFACYVRE